MLDINDNFLTFVENYRFIVMEETVFIIIVGIFSVMDLDIFIYGSLFVFEFLFCKENFICYNGDEIFFFIFDLGIITYFYLNFSVEKIDIIICVVFIFMIKFCFDEFFY